MKPLERTTLLCALAVLAYGCDSDRRLAGLGAAKTLRADVTAEDQQAYGPWGVPVNLGPVVNSPYNDQHPGISKDGLSLYISSDRPGGFGGLDIWVSQRESLGGAWGPPQNLGPEINSSGNDLAPDLTIDGHRMFFHSARARGCGGTDLYVTRRRDRDDDFGWSAPENLGCTINSPENDAGPTFFEDDVTGITTLIFTSLNRPGNIGDWDIYQSTLQPDGSWGPGVLIRELSSPSRDTRTALRRDGLEIFLSSGRPGGQGSEDLWVSTRASTLDLWGTPVNLGPTVNSTAFDGGPALSFDGTELYFFSNRLGGSGGNDLYVATRHRLGGPDVAVGPKPETQPRRGMGETE
ncbi:MAG TPA: hypothetical protein VH137_04215 [Gemmatimonadales bacterium]|nr:hypothetical protein [Gemmatimonadales bacterium]